MGLSAGINKPRTRPSASWYSQKYNNAGLTYELGTSIQKNQLVWINSPFRAGTSDLQMFQMEGGLKSKIPANKRFIGDSGYPNEPQISHHNMFDNPMVRTFKKRARAHHQAFNGRIKNFSILDQQFRVAKHKACFKAVCFMVQYNMGNGHPMLEF
jgi:hypothetical protein